MEIKSWDRAPVATTSSFRGRGVTCRTKVGKRLKLKRGREWRKVEKEERLKLKRILRLERG